MELAQAAVALSRRIGGELRLVHVVRPEYSPAFYRDPHATDPYWYDKLSQATIYEVDEPPHGAAEREAHAVLRSRASGLKERIEASGGSYATEVAIGDVRDEMASLLIYDRPDIAVFGRHHLLHRQPARIGNVPFGEMLAGARSVIVAADQ